MKKKLTIAMVTVSMLAVGTIAWIADAADTSKDPVVVKAGSVEIRQSEFEAALKTLPAQYQAYAMGPGKKAFAEDYLRMRLLAAEAEKSGLDKSEEVQTQLQMMRANALANAELQKLTEDVKVTPEELQKAYTAKKDTLEKVHARHILIAFKGSPAAPQQGALTEERAKAKAEEIRKQLVAGADFAELAKKESDDKGSGARGGDVGEFSRGQMVPEFEKAAFETKVGEISPVTRTQYGYHIIKVESHSVPTLDQVKEQLEEDIRKEAVDKKVSSLQDQAKPTFDNGYFGTTPVPTPHPPTPPPAQ
ncbi:MAG: peptidylprolyl isomerase [Thermoanaerobaculia bacterium]